MRRDDRKIHRPARAACAPRGLGLAWLLAAWLAGAAGCEKGEREAGERKPAPQAIRGVVVLDAGRREKAAIEVAALEPTKLRPWRTAYGRVLPPDSLLEIHREISAAEAALTASRADFDRNRALLEAGEGTSRKAVEASEAQFHADEIRLRDARRRLSLDWGADLAAQPAAEREALVDALASGRAALVLAALPSGQYLPGRPEGAAVEVTGRQAVRAAAVLSAPRADAGLQGDAYLLRVDGAPALRPGLVTTARIELSGEPMEGVVVPAAAIVWHEGRAWAWTEEAQGRFVRREVSLESPVDGGWFAQRGFRAGERVVVKGAQTLLSAELSSSILLEEE